MPDWFNAATATLFAILGALSALLAGTIVTARGEDPRLAALPLLVAAACVYGLFYFGSLAL